MSTAENFSTNEKFDNEEYIEDPGMLVNQDRSYNLSKVEHEKCKQQIHDLKQKLRLNEAMLREVNEANESLERLFDQRISESEQLMCQVKERHRTLAKEYEDTVSNLETKSAQQTREIEELRRRADRCVNARVAQDPAVVSVNSPDTDDISLRNRIDELLSIQREERKKYEHAERSIAELKSRCEHYECYVQAIKEQLGEKDQTLEEIRAELALKRAEVESLRTADPTRESCKGNSIFAEVEDRRQNVVNKMNALREKYAELKRTCKCQITEIKSLRADRAATLRKLENDARCTLTENEELIQKYKTRISDLENKLKSEIRRNSDSNQSNLGDASFRYFQSLLDTKKKETVELRTRVEDLSTKLLLQEETRTNIAKQLHYWRYKASSLEDRIDAVRAKLKLCATSDAEHELLRELNDHAHERDIDTTIDEKRSISSQRSRNSVQSRLNHSPEVEHTDSSTKNSERCKAYGQRTDKNGKENCNRSSGTTTELEIITPRKSRKFRCDQTTGENEDKPLVEFPRSAKNATTRCEAKISPSSVECEYPVIYISANDLDDR